MGSISQLAASEATAATVPTTTDAADSSAGQLTIPEEHDILIFADGDRTLGQLVRREGKTIVFRSFRFGELTVSSDSARVIRANPDESVVAAPPAPPPTGPTTDGVASGAAATDASATSPRLSSRSWWTSPAAMAESLRDLFGSWHGRFSLASSSVSDTTDRSSIVVESKLGRKWATDEVNVEARYETGTTNNAVTADIVKGTGSWRHDLTRRYFLTYRPTLEWNRNYRLRGLTFDYVLLQEELGVGVNLTMKKGRKFRVGIAENLFDVWVYESPTRHDSSSTESIFAEVEWQLPWRITLNDRGIFYYSLRNQTQGWENRFEVNKKLTETLSLSLRHEYRRNSPDVRLSDYSLWRFLLGLDF